MTTYKKKLIEVALPLEEINKESAREKSIRHGHPSTLHLWWARRPLAACRAVLFAQLVDDPEQDGLSPDYLQLVDQLPLIDKYKDQAKIQAEERRFKLFGFIERLVKWENIQDESLYNQAHALISASCDGNPPPIYDPFSGGGSIPLEAQRLGLETYGSDLNPVAVMIGKALIEIPPKFAGQEPMNPDYQAEKVSNPKLLKQVWKGAKGLAEDVRYYGQWMREEAFKRIGHLYPKVDEAGNPLPPDDPNGYTVIAWIWARTVATPNPALTAIWGESKWGEAVYGGIHVPLVRSFELSTKKGKEAWVEPVISEDGRSYRFEVRQGIPSAKWKNGTVERTGGRCLLTDVPMPFEWIRAEGKAGRMKQRLMAVVAEGPKGRLYLSPTEEMEKIAEQATPYWKPEQELPINPRDFKTPNYGMNTFGDLFTLRQLSALTTFSDLIMGNEAQNMPSVHAKIQADYLQVHAFPQQQEEIGRLPSPPPQPSPAGGGRSSSRVFCAAEIYATPEICVVPEGEALPPPAGEGWGGGPDLARQAKAYADAVSVYLAFSVDKGANYWSSLCAWHTSAEKMMSTYARQALPMVWDFTEANPLSDSSGNFLLGVSQAAKSIEAAPVQRIGTVEQKTAQEGLLNSTHKVVSTDPPYYDNIGYADLSDFFYVWLRRSLKSIYPDIFSTLMVPKGTELVATPYRHGTKKEAEDFFLNGMTKAMHNIQQQQPDGYPVTIYYAFKQSEVKEGAISSTGWATFLEAVMKAGFSINGTWPIKSELTTSLKKGQNFLASSVVLVCRKQHQNAPTITRKDFIQYLRRELPGALKNLQHSNLAPVDMAQASIGPGMAIFSRYAKVMEADGSSMSVKTALQLINESLDEYLAEQEGEYDSDTRFAITWFEQFGTKEGDYGQAEQLANARNVSVQGVVASGILTAKAGKVQIIPRKDMPDDWNPQTDDRPTVWEAVQHIIKRAFADGGYHETAAAELYNKLGSLADTVRDLAYRLYSICERNKWADEALAYNNLVTNWPDIVERANQLKQAKPETPVQQKFVEV